MPLTLYDIEVSSRLLLGTARYPFSPRQSADPAPRSSPYRFVAKRPAARRAAHSSSWLRIWVCMSCRIPPAATAHQKPC